MARESKGIYQERTGVRYSFKHCKRCEIDFKNGDSITTVQIRTKNSFRTEIYHSKCWDKKFY